MLKISSAIAIVTLLTVEAAGPALAAVHLSGLVQAGGGAVAQSTVTLWTASAGAPTQLAQAQTDSDGPIRSRQQPVHR
jgi:hypothetical protein